MECVANTQACNIRVYRSREVHSLILTVASDYTNSNLKGASLSFHYNNIFA